MVNETTMSRSKAVSNIIPKSILREVQLETMQRVADALQNSYGPNGSTTLIRTGKDENDTGVTSYTKDGHRILSNIKFSKPIEYSIVDDLETVTRNTVKTVGDGTTSAVILSNEIFKALYDYSTKNHISEKKIVSQLEDAVKNISNMIQSHGRECTLDDIWHIAYTSTDGNAYVADTIKKIYKEQSMDAYINVGVSNTQNTVIKQYDGINIDSGYFNTTFITNEKEALAELNKPYIYIFEDAIDTKEMLNFCYKIIEDNILTPLAKYSEAYQKKNQKQADKAIMSMKATVIFSPAFGGDIRTRMDDVLEGMEKAPVGRRVPLLLVTNVHDMERLMDLAKLSGARSIKKYIDPVVQENDQKNGLAPTMETISNWFAGQADKVVADAKNTNVINPKNMFDKEHKPTEMFTKMIAGLKAQLKQLEETKTEITELNRLRTRINSLQGNLVDYLVGGISYEDRDALKDAVEDAVLNCRNAAKYGVGFGANFEGLRASNDLLKNGEIYKVINTAYKNAVKLIYFDYLSENNISIDDLVKEELKLETPFDLNDLMNSKYNGSWPKNKNGKYVLTSIQTDQVILNAIAKIVGLMFKTNQYICPTPAFNTYSDI